MDFLLELLTYDCPVSGKKRIAGQAELFVPKHLELVWMSTDLSNRANLFPVWSGLGSARQPRALNRLLPPQASMMSSTVITSAEVWLNVRRWEKQLQCLELQTFLVMIILDIGRCGVFGGLPSAA